ncbi:MAG: ATPase, T2SS/T4P/T4SS family [Candidatus Hodarchaeota archaeon]
MVLNLKERVIFQEKENFEGKKENFLIIDCKKCSEKEKKFYKNITCIYCFLLNLFINKNNKFNRILISKNEILIEPEQYDLVLDYFKNLNKIKRINQKIENLRKKRCVYQEFKCKNFPEYFSLVKIHDFEFYDPVLVYNTHLKRISYIEDNRIFNDFCLKCVNYLKSLESSIAEILNHLKIIKMLNTFKSESEKAYHSLKFYKRLFSKSFQLHIKDQESKIPTLLTQGDLIKTYMIGKNNLYQVYITNISFEAENKYLVHYNYQSRSEEDYIRKIIQDISNSLNIVNFDQIIPLENLINLYNREALKILSEKYRFSKIDNKKIAFISALKRLNLEKIFPLLIDDFIEEIFLDSPYDKIYINHQKYGRCRTDLKFNRREIERIKTLLRLYSGQRLDYMKPSIKLVLKNKFFYCRFALDIEPIQLNNFALDIRKLNKNILNIQDLLKNGTLSPLMASFLYFNILRRRNLTVTGETDTGKTTLINALDLLTPKEFRKIYIENIVESLNQFSFGKHQLKYKVDSYDSLLKEKYSKSSQIKTLLHRTPDIIYLGEILTKEEAEAMFHCLAAGLRGFQTIHSNNIESLINRFVYHFKINKSCLDDLDLIILMKKDGYQRKIISISEIGNDLDIPKLYNNIFQYNPESKKWNLLNPLFETKIVNELRRYEDLNRENFSLIIKIYNEIFTFISKIKKIDNYKLINFFHRISYNSFQSYDILKNFWNNWKKNRGLNF